MLRKRSIRAGILPSRIIGRGIMRGRRGSEIVMEGNGLELGGGRRKIWRLMM